MGPCGSVRRSSHTVMQRNIRLFLIGLVVCLLGVVGPLAFVKWGQFSAMQAAGAAMTIPPTTVTAAAAKQETWGNTLSAPGSLEAVRGVTVAAEVGGKVSRIAFEPGATVEAGAVLIELDASTEEAELRAAEAGSKLARADLDRLQNLHREGIISHAELDSTQATATRSIAQAESIRATIAKKSIRAPFAGRLGLRQVNLGQILREGDPITVLQTLDPIFVNFSVPQQHLADLGAETAVRITTDAARGTTFEGRINAVSPEVDLATRSLRVQATIANTEEKLRPGMYANVEIVLPNPLDVLVIPATAVLYAPYGDSVFVIDEQKDEKGGEASQVLRQQFVRLGVGRGDFVSVVDGLEAGDTIVSTGVFKLRPGTKVVVDNRLAPPMELAPKPDNA